MNKPKKPDTRAGYSQDSLDRIQSAALHINTVLGDLSEEIVIVGGLVPSLLMKDKADKVPEHAGTMDLDLGLSVGLLHGGRYTEISDRLFYVLQYYPEFTTCAEEAVTTLTLRALTPSNTMSSFGGPREVPVV